MSEFEGKNRKKKKRSKIIRYGKEGGVEEEKNKGRREGRKEKGGKRKGKKINTVQV